MKFDFLLLCGRGNDCCHVLLAKCPTRHHFIRREPGRHALHSVWDLCSVAMLGSFPKCCSCSQHKRALPLAALMRYTDLLLYVYLLFLVAWGRGVIPKWSHPQNQVSMEHLKWQQMCPVFLQIGWSYIILNHSLGASSLRLEVGTHFLACYITFLLNDLLQIPQQISHLWPSSGAAN